MWLPMPRYPSRTALAIRAAHAHAAVLGPLGPPKVLRPLRGRLDLEDTATAPLPLAAVRGGGSALANPTKQAARVAIRVAPCPWQKEGWGGVSLWTWLGLGLGLGLG